jgi:preprotein translocase subunit Sec61beta
VSRKKRRAQESPMPAGSAGLLSFYQEKTDSVVKIGPEIVIILTITLILAVILASIFVPK